MTARSVALQGIGYSTLLVALQGFGEQVSVTFPQGFGSYPQPMRPRITAPPHPGRRLIESEEEVLLFLAAALQLLN